MEGKKRPCEWSSTILEVLMEDYYFLENFGTQLGTSSEIFGTSSYLFGSFITKSWLSRVKVKARKHRRTGNFRPGGAVNHLPKKFLQVAQIFTKHSKRNEGYTMQQHRPYWHMKVPRYSFSGSIPTKFEHKLRCHKQTFGKIATTVVLNKDENLLWSGLQ